MYCAINPRDIKKKEKKKKKRKKGPPSRFILMNLLKHHVQYKRTLAHNCTCVGVGYVTDGKPRAKGTRHRCVGVPTGVRLFVSAEAAS